MKLVTVDEMRKIEETANQNGLTFETMMDNAGSGLAELVHSTFGSLPEKNAAGLVGSGNNGGDTLIALTRLTQMGWKSTAFLARPREENDPLVASLVQAGGEIASREQDKRLTKLHQILVDTDVLLDGVLGTGVKLPLKPEISGVLGKVKDFVDAHPPRLHVVAVDCPSGVDCDTGDCADESIPAEMTVCMAAVKKGLLKFPAFNRVGRLHVVDIGLPANLPAWKAAHDEVADARMVKAMIPERPADAHKGKFGKGLVVAGSVNYTGAALLSGEAAYRVGVGWVTLAVPAPLHPVLAGRLPEATWLLLPHELGVISVEAVEIVNQNLERASAVLLGPGWGLEETTARFLSRFLSRGDLPERGDIGFAKKPDHPKKETTATVPPLVIDADGLKLLARIQGWPGLLPKGCILTPHVGEMAVLTGLTVEQIQGDRFGVAEKFAREWGQTVILKGACSLIASPEGGTVAIPVATPALARAGTGDVLSGMVLGLRSQGLPAREASVAAAWLHAQAGLAAAARMGNTASVIAGDVLAAVPPTLSALLNS